MTIYAYLCFFFFSSRRRHTRFDCDWSSDVCSSDLDDADIWQYSFSFIVNMDGHEIVPPSTHCQCSRKIGRLKIRNEENHSASCDNFIQIIEGQRRLCAASLWFEKQNLPDKS